MRIINSQFEKINFISQYRNCISLRFKSDDNCQERNCSNEFRSNNIRKTTITYVWRCTVYSLAPHRLRMITDAQTTNRRSWHIEQSVSNCSTLKIRTVLLERTYNQIFLRRIIITKGSTSFNTRRPSNNIESSEKLIYPNTHISLTDRSNTFNVYIVIFCTSLPFTYLSAMEGEGT